MLNIVQNGKQLTVDANGNLNINLAAGSISGGNAAAGLTGAGVPLSADYLGVNVAGNLIGVTGLSLTNAKAATVAIVDGSGNQITSFGGGTQYATGTAVATPTGTAALGWDGANVRVLSTDSTGKLNILLTSTTITGTVAVTQSTSPWVDNITQFGSTNISTGTGASGAGIPRVTVSNDSVIQLWDGTTAAKILPANNALKIDLSSVNGATTGTSGIGIQKVGIVGSLASSLDTNASQNQAMPVNMLLVGAEFNTSPTGITSGNASPLQLDTNANLLVNINAQKTALTITGTTTISNTSLPVSEIQGSPLLEILNTIWLELKGLRLATVADTCDGGHFNERDFDPAYLVTSASDLG